ncbi:MAG: metallophosphoesterase family protein [Desulfobacterium sp.]|jgi:diadenosine tetraphosphatase ApaH/serine/threonine PP2A family protein phosphatase|nr:metallophosphoesterase family protein [Desulfobacterium sp.]
MRIAVFSDIHSNVEALEAFIEHAAVRRINRYICLGDIVGYGANPNSCISLVQTMPEIRFIVGNHDNAVTGGGHRMGLNAAQAMSWTRMRLSPESRVFLKGLKESIKTGDLFFCHANPCGVSDWYYISKKALISRTFFLTRAKILFAGHTHSPAVITRKNFLCVYIRKPENRSVVPVARVNRQIFNCGSIGQPRDGDPRASYLIYDTERRVVEFHRVAYDHERAAKKIISAGLPEALALRLSLGR